MLSFINKGFESNLFKYSVLVFFSILLAWLKFNHVLERDESQMILIVQSNPCFWNLVSTFAYEGTTGLWYVLLWSVSHIFEINPVSVTIIHYLFVVLFIWYLIFRIEAPMIIKIIFLVQLNVLWHFIFIRQYILVLLFLAMLIRSIYYKKDYLVFILIFLLMQLHVLVISIAVSFWIYYSLIKYVNKEKYNLWLHIIPVAGIILAVLQLLPPDDLIYGLKGWNTEISIYGFILLLNKIIKHIFYLELTYLLILILPPFIIYLIGKSWEINRKALIVFLISVAFVFLSYIFLDIVKYVAYYHYFFLYFSLLAFCFLLYKNIGIKFNIKWYYLLIPVLLYSGYLMRVQVLNYDYAPISYADKVAEYLDEKYPDKTILTIPEPYYNSVAVYRKNKYPVYSLGRHDFIEYVVWDHESVDYRGKDLVPVKLEELKKEILNVPDSILKSNPVLVMGTDLTNIIIDENEIPVMGDIEINNNLRLKFIKYWGEKD